MYDINTSNLKKYNFLYYIVFFMILFLIGIMLYIIISSNITKNKMDSNTLSIKMEVQSITGRDKILYNPTYYYVVDGIEYACKTNVSSSKYPKEQSTIYYNSKKPSECISDFTTSSNKLLIILCTMFSFALTMPIFNIKKVKKRLKEIAILKEKGKLIKGLEYTLEDSDDYVNNKAYKVIVVNYEINGETHKLVSDIRYDEDNFSKYDKVDLLIDPLNPNNYYIDFNIKIKSFSNKND